MEDWLRNMGDWCISRKRYWGLPLPFYPCSCGHVNVIGSRAELGSARPAGSSSCRSCTGRGSTRSRSAARRAASRGRADHRGRRLLARRRHRAVLDARLAEPRVRAGGLRNGRGEGADQRRPAGPRVLGAVVPGGLGLRDARADPALVLLAAVHEGDARRPRAVPARARLREDARRDRPPDAQVVGQRDRGRRGHRAHGRRRDALALLRRSRPPEHELRLRPGRTR